MDDATARTLMVETQIRTNDITDPALLEALRRVPREKFVGADRRSVAYLDQEQKLSGAQGPRYMLKPLTLARMIQVASPRPCDKALILGGMTGYSAAVVSQLTTSTVMIEEDSDLVKTARTTLDEAGFGAIKILSSPLPAGDHAHAPYDVILIEGRVEHIPEALFGQLAEGGRLVCLMGPPPATRITLFRKGGGQINQQLFSIAAGHLLTKFEQSKEFVF